MYISKIRVQNYKAFYDSGWIEFKPGINIISGQNHSGKTALLEALSMNFPNLPHKSLKTLPNIFSTIIQYSEIEIAVVFSQKERINLLAEVDQKIDLPTPPTDQIQNVCRAITRCIERSVDMEIFMAYPYNGYDFKDEPIEVLEIEEWMLSEKQKWVDKQIQKGMKQEDLTDDYWLAKVHAAKSLENLFRHFSDGKIVYRKTTHSIELTKWLIENKSEQLQDIADLLKNILGRSFEVNLLG